MKQAQWPVHSTLGNIMVLMTCRMGMWILNIGLPSGRPKKSCPFCLARGLKGGTKGHMRTIMYMQWAYVQAEQKLCHSPNPWTIPQKPYTFPWKRFATLLHTPRPTLKIPIKFRLLYFEDKLSCLRFHSPCQDCVRYTPRSKWHVRFCKVQINLLQTHSISFYTQERVYFTTFPEFSFENPRTV
jgi:hypothetical protein